jgi:uncharacterized YigZ family protein
MGRVARRPRPASADSRDRPPGYEIPAGVHRVEQTIRRSRFIATVGPAQDARTATAFVQHVRDEFPDATHHCWAYVAGPPATTSSIGLSDDGEPHGTAGRPILAALQHSDVGDVVVVVTRYYGGTNLGTGGLVRAYGGTARLALEGAGRSMRVQWACVEIAVPYADVPATRRCLEPFGTPLQLPPRDGCAVLAQRIPADSLAALRECVADATHGRASVGVRPATELQPRI